MKLEVGKRYNRRDGGVSGVITVDDGCTDKHPFKDQNSGSTYTSTGYYWYIGITDEPDLIIEYIEPTEWQLVTSYDQINRKDVVVSWSDSDPVAFKVVVPKPVIRVCNVDVTGDDIKVDWVE